MSTEIKNNAQFNSFVAFAQKAMAEGSTKAVARTGDMVKGADGLASRSITAATTDKAFAFSRTMTDKSENDAVRDLFRQSLIDMFGSEDKIPQSVKKAMLLKDYEVGKPLTARRIMAVKRAVDSFMDPIPKMSRQLAEAAVDHAVEHVNAKHLEINPTGKGFPKQLSLTPQQTSMAAGMVAKYGKGLTRDCIGLLASYTVNVLACGDMPDVEYYVATFANDVSKFRNFMPGDSRFAAVDELFLKHSQASVKDFLSTAHAKEFDGDGLFNGFLADVPRADYSINGHTYVHGVDSPADAINAFKMAVKPEHRKALSAFLNQQATTPLTCMTAQYPLPSTADLPSGVDVSKAQNIGMFISNEVGGTYCRPMAAVKGQHYSVDVAPDGKSAKVVVETMGNLVFNPTDTNSDNVNNIVGGMKWRQEFDFDLSSETPTIVAARIGQSIEA